MSQPNSQSSTADSVESFQFTNGMRSDGPFHFTESRTPVVKAIRKSRVKSLISTRRGIQLSKSDLQPSRKPGHHYRGERQISFNASTQKSQSQSKQLPQARHTYSRAVPARPSGTDHMPNARTSQRPKPDTQPPLESQLSMLPSQLSQSSSQLPPLSKQLPATPSPPVAVNPGVRVKQFPTDDEMAICRLAQNQVILLFYFY
jgi:hypothetical protein